MQSSGLPFPLKTSLPNGSSSPSDRLVLHHHSSSSSGHSHWQTPQAQKLSYFCSPGDEKRRHQPLPNLHQRRGQKHHPQRSTKCSSPFALDLNIDLTGRTLWFYCDGFNSVTYHAFRCGTSECRRATYDFCIDCDGPFPPGCSHYQCGKYIRNWLIVQDNNTSLLIDFFFTSQLGRDVFFIPSTLGGIVKTPMIFSCGEKRALQSLPNSTVVGAIGLGKLNISIPSQLASRYNIPWKFALCLPSKAGLVGGLYISGGPYFLPPYSGDLSKIFVSTPLVTDSIVTDPVYDRSQEYFIGVESIEIDGKALPLNKTLLVIEPKFGNGGTKISTLAPYSVLHTSIYKTLLETFTTKAKLARAAAIPPFGACFRSRGLSGGPAVPIIDLVLKGGGKWKIYGSNSLVKVKRDVVCLGFVDGGERPDMASIVIGGNLLEDNLVEFDVESSKISFTSSLLVHNTSCSRFKP